MTTPTKTDAKRLTGHLGPIGIVFMVVAAAAPLTVIGGNMPLAMGLGNGAGAPMGFVIAALVLLVFSIGFVTMTPHVPEAGAFFSYVTVGLGERMGKGIAVVALIAYTAIQVGIYGYIGWAISDTVAHYNGPVIPWPLYAFAVLAIVAVLGYRHIELSAKVLGVALALEIGIVVVLDVAMIAKPSPAGVTFTSFDPTVFTQGTIGIAILFALTGFIGFEATAVFRDEARDPERTIPRATYAAVILIGAFYAITVWAFVVAIGPDQVSAVAQRTLDGEGNMLLDTTGDMLGLGRPRHRQRPTSHQPVRLRAVLSQRHRALSVRAGRQGPTARPGWRRSTTTTMRRRSRRWYRPSRPQSSSPSWQSSASIPSSGFSARWQVSPR